MKKLTVKVIAASLIALSAFSVSALEKPVSSRLDKRVLYTEHKEGQVYPINAVNGVITAIVFADGEKVLDWGSGYSTAWEFAARNNHFFLKPKDFQGTTNLVVVTDRYTYLFDVKLTSNKKNATYSMTFRYPMLEAQKAQEEAKKKTVNALLSNSPLNEAAIEDEGQKNTLYTENFGSSSLSRDLAPLEVFDDGQFTYLKFDKHTDFPAVYRVADDDEETLLNSHVKGQWLVIHGIYKELRLRAGQGVVGIYNDGYSGGGVRKETGVSVPGVERRLIKEVN